MALDVVSIYEVVMASLNMNQFKKHIASFQSIPLSEVGFTGYGSPEEEFSDASCAEGECNTARSAFQRSLKQKGLPHGKAVRFESTDDDDDFEHYVSEHDVEGVPHIVDFTFRQLEPKAEFPVVMPSQHYEKRMAQHRLSRWGDYDPEENGQIG